MLKLSDNTGSLISDRGF